MSCLATRTLGALENPSRVGFVSFRAWASSNIDFESAVKSGLTGLGGSLALQDFARVVSQDPGAQLLLL